MNDAFKNIKKGIGWVASVFFLVIGLFGTLAGDVQAGVGIAVMGLALLPKIQKVGSINVNGWMRAGAFFLGAIIVGSGGSSTNEQPTPQQQEAPAAVIEEQQKEVEEIADKPEPVAKQKEPMQIPQEANTVQKVESSVTVVRVIDGDTVVIQTAEGTEEHLRIVGVDAQEKGDCYTNEATNRLVGLAQGKAVILEKGSSDERDSFGRLLHYLRIGDTDIGATLIREGFVRSFKKYPHPRLEIYNGMEEAAMREQKGLWSACKEQEQEEQAPAPQPVQQNTPPAPTTSGGGGGNPSATPPEDQPPPPEEQECVIKGNVNSKKEKIYHFPGCQAYNKTKVQAHEGDRWFCTEAEASAAGFRRAGNCP